ncbi:MAG: hypothetical protein IPH13_05520 [Planctomycetes bacterium]|nr:hypothetical protein [Planctomycetota bacterium]
MWFPSDGLGQPVPWTNPAIRVLVVGEPKIKWSEPDLQTQRMTARCVFSFDRGDGTVVEKSIELGTKGPMESVTTEEHRYSVSALDRETWKPARAFPELAGPGRPTERKMLDAARKHIEASGEYRYGGSVAAPSLKPDAKQIVLPHGKFTVKNAASRPFVMRVIAYQNYRGYWNRALDVTPQLTPKKTQTMPFPSPEYVHGFAFLLCTPTGVSGPWWVEAGKGAHAVTIGEPILPPVGYVRAATGSAEDPTAPWVFTYSAWPMAQTLVVKVHNEEGAGDLTCEVLDPAGNVIAVSHGADLANDVCVVQIPRGGDLPIRVRAQGARGPLRFLCEFRAIAHDDLATQCVNDTASEEWAFGLVALAIAAARNNDAAAAQIMWGMIKSGAGVALSIALVREVVEQLGNHAEIAWENVRTEEVRDLVRPATDLVPDGANAEIGIAACFVDRLLAQIEAHVYDTAIWQPEIDLTLRKTTAPPK